MKHPVPISLKSGESFLFCKCGNSADGVICDNSHIGTEFEPEEFIATRTSVSYLCRCKKTTCGAYCDGAHAIPEKLKLDFLLD